METILQLLECSTNSTYEVCVSVKCALCLVYRTSPLKAHVNGLTVRVTFSQVIARKGAFSAVVMFYFKGGNPAIAHLSFSTFSHPYDDSLQVT